VLWSRILQDIEKCETGLIEAMAKLSFTTTKIASFSIKLLLTISVFAQILVFGCLPEPYRGRQSRSRIFNTDVIINVEKIFPLNRGNETISLTPNLSAEQGKPIYGRLIVPKSSKSWTLEVLAHWSNHYPSTPLWLYIKKDRLPTTSDFDKTGVSFTSRQFSRIRVHEAEPGGVYFVMVEAMQDIDNLTMEMKLINNQPEESLRSNFAWPRRISVP